MVDRIERIQALYRALGRQDQQDKAPADPRADAGAALQDTLTLHGDWHQTDWAKAVHGLLQSLQDSFPDIHIVTGSAPDEDALRQLAEQLGGGKHLVIDADFVAQMAQGPEAFEKGRETLLWMLRALHHMPVTGVYIGPDRAQSWQRFETPPEEKRLETAKRMLYWFAEMNREREEQKPQLFSPPRQYSTKGKYTRLARAQSVGQINLLMSDINSEIDNLQGEAMGTGENAAKARRAIRSLRVLLSRATRKISRLQAEQLVSAKQKRAEREQKQEEARRLRQMQQEQHTKRRRADAQTASGGIVQPSSQGKRGKYYGYDAFAATAAPACPLPAVSVGDAGGTQGGSVIELGPEMAL